LKRIIPGIFIIITILIASCNNPFAPRLDTNLGDNGSLISSQKSIEGLFQNFKYSYAFRDTTIYGGLLNSDYIFVYRDHELNIDVSWGRDDEMRITNGLFNTSQQLDLIWNNIVSMTSDSTNIIRSFNLSITINPTTIFLVDGRVNLELEKNDKGVWKIVNWIDESNF
jgi:hypothetical protein